ncbi:MAG: hypothetical protein ABR568_17245 [Pyrinomonadaceae bacterium]
MKRNDLQRARGRQLHPERFGLPVPKATLHGTLIAHFVTIE